MKTLNLTVPIKSGVDQNDVVKFLAAKLYESGRLTVTQAAHMVGMRAAEFADILSQYGVSFFNYPASDIKKDVSNA
jgi:predicted HTH domain antitoxin